MGGLLGIGKWLQVSFVPKLIKHIRPLSFISMRVGYYCTKNQTTYVSLPIRFIQKQLQNVAFGATRLQKQKLHKNSTLCIMKLGGKKKKAKHTLEALEIFPAWKNIESRNGFQKNIKSRDAQKEVYASFKFRIS